MSLDTRKCHETTLELGATMSEHNYLTETKPNLKYANLAIRGKLVGHIAEEQDPAAAAMGADLVSFAGGVNDLMRPRCAG